MPEVDTSSRQLPSTTPTSGVFVVDTGDLFGALEGQSSQRRNLERMCRLLGIKDCKYMHNAGNDAHVSSPSMIYSHLIYESSSGDTVHAHSTRGDGSWSSAGYGAL